MFAIGKAKWRWKSETIFGVDTAKIATRPISASPSNLTAREGKCDQARRRGKCDHVPNGERVRDMNKEKRATVLR
jgi:hypothetical protein